MQNITSIPLLCNAQQEGTTPPAGDSAPAAASTTRANITHLYLDYPIGEYAVFAYCHNFASLQFEGLVHVWDESTVHAKICTRTCRQGTHAAPQKQAIATANGTNLADCHSAATLFNIVLRGIASTSTSVDNVFSEGLAAAKYGTSTWLRTDMAAGEKAAATSYRRGQRTDAAHSHTSHKTNTWHTQLADCVQEIEFCLVAAVGLGAACSEYFVCPGRNQFPIKKKYHTLIRNTVL